jgi:hypothetical protein
MPKVSVIVPTYNRAHIVGEAIQSILDQSMPDFEILVIDDGSTDETAEVISGFLDGRLRYLKRPNGGVSAARNMGLKQARSSLLAFLDSDDLYLPEKLAVQVEKMDSAPDLGFLYGRYFGQVASRPTRHPTGKCVPDLGIEQLVLGPVFHWSSVMVRRSWIDRVGEFDERLKVAEEWQFSMRMALAGCQMACIAQPLSVARIQSVSLSRQLYRHADSAQRALAAIFEHPAWPSDRADLVARAYAFQQIRLAASAFLDENPAVGLRFLEKALAHDPALSGQDRDLFAARLSGYLSGLSLDDPAQVIASAAESLADHRQLARELHAVYQRDRAFRANRLERWPEARQAAQAALKHKPAYLLNRGLVAVLLRSLRN